MKERDRYQDHEKLRYYGLKNNDIIIVGFVGDEEGRCADIDECEDNPCTQGYCTNLVGKQFHIKNVFHEKM